METPEAQALFGQARPYMEQGDYDGLEALLGNLRALVEAAAGGGAALAPGVAPDGAAAFPQPTQAPGPAPMPMPEGAPQPMPLPEGAPGPAPMPMPEGAPQPVPAPSPAEGSGALPTTEGQVVATAGSGAEGGEDKDHRRAINTLMACRDKMAELSGKGSDISMAKGVLDRAKPLLRNKEYEPVYVLATKCMEVLRVLESGATPPPVDVEALLAQHAAEAEAARAAGREDTAEAMDGEAPPALEPEPGEAAVEGEEAGAAATPGEDTAGEVVCAVGMGSEGGMPAQGFEYTPVPSEAEGDLKGIFATTKPDESTDEGLAILFSMPATEEPQRQMSSLLDTMTALEGFVEELTSAGAQMGQIGTTLQATHKTAGALLAKMEELVGEIDAGRKEMLQRKFTGMIDTADEYVRSLGVLGIALNEEGETSVDAARISLENARYDEITDHLNKGVCSAFRDTRRHLFCVVETRLRSVEQGLARAEEEGVPVDDVRNFRDGARGKLEAGDFVAALDVQEKAASAMDEAVLEFRRDKAKTALEEALGVVAEMEGLGIVSEEVQGGIASATTALEADEFDHVHENAGAARKTAGGLITEHHRNRIKEFLDELTVQLSEIKKIGASHEMSERLIHQGSKEWSDGNYTRAEEVLNRGKKAVKAAKTQFYRERAENALEDAKATLASIAGKGVDLTEEQRKLDNIGLDVAVGRYEGVTEGVAECVEAARGAEVEHYKALSSRAIEDLEGEKEGMKDYAPDFTAVDQGITRMRELHEAGSHNDALDQVEGARSLLREALVQAKKKMAEHVVGTLKTAKEIIEQYRPYDVTFTGAEELFNQAKNQLQGEQLLEASATAGKAKERAERTRDEFRRDRAMAARAKLDEVIEGGVRFGLDVSRADPVKEEFDRRLEEGGFEKAAESVQTLARELEAQTQELKARLSREAISALKFTKGGIDELEGFGLDVSSLRELFNTAKGALDSEDYSRAVDVAREVDTNNKETKNRFLEDAVNTGLSNSEEAMEKYKGAGLDIAIAEDIRGQARFALLANEFEKAWGLLKNLEGMLGPMEQNYTQAMEQKARAEEEEKRRVEEEKQKAEEEARRKVEEEARLEAEEEARKEAVEEEKKREEEAAAAGAAAPAEAVADAETPGAPAPAPRIEVPPVQMPDVSGLTPDEHKMKAVLVLKDAREHIARAKGKGIDVTQPEEHFNQARPHLAASDFNKAMEVGLQVAAIVRKLEYQKEWGETADTRKLRDEARSLLASAKSETDARASTVLDMARSLTGAPESGGGAPAPPDATAPPDGAAGSQGPAPGGSPQPAPADTQPPASPDPQPAAPSDPQPPAPAGTPPSEGGDAAVAVGGAGPVDAQQAITALRSARQIIAAAKAQGRDVKQAEALFQQAQPAIKGGQFDRALEIANQCIAAVQENPAAGA